MTLRAQQLLVLGLMLAALLLGKAHGQTNCWDPGCVPCGEVLGEHFTNSVPITICGTNVKGRYHILFNMVSNETYQVQYAHFSVGPWFAFTHAFTADTTTTFSFDDEYSKCDQQRYWRVLKQ